MWHNRSENKNSRPLSQSTISPSTPMLATRSVSCGCATVTVADVDCVSDANTEPPESRTSIDTPSASVRSTDSPTKYTQ